MQIDKLVQLLESPVFVHLRLQLLDVESPHHTPLLKSCYGLLMLLPQSDAFRSLSDRLTTVCNLRDNLGIPPAIFSTNNSRTGVLSDRQLDLLAHFDKVMDFHRKLRGREMQQTSLGELVSMNRIRTSSSANAYVRGTGRPVTTGTLGMVSSSGNASPSVFYTASEPTAPNCGRITQEV